ncbi:hypothetical protein BDR22DRAFT_864646 [Usnea florida]
MVHREHGLERANGYFEPRGCNPKPFRMILRSYLAFIWKHYHFLVIDRFQNFLPLFTEFRIVFSNFLTRFVQIVHP